MICPGCGNPSSFTLNSNGFYECDFCGGHLELATQDSSGSKIEKILTNAKVYENLGYIGEAKKLLEAGIKEYPGNYRLWFYCAALIFYDYTCMLNTTSSELHDMVLQIDNWQGELSLVDTKAHLLIAEYMSNAIRLAGENALTIIKEYDRAIEDVVNKIRKGEYFFDASIWTLGATERSKAVIGALYNEAKQLGQGYKNGIFYIGKTYVYKSYYTGEFSDQQYTRLKLVQVGHIYSTQEIERDQNGRCHYCGGKRKIMSKKCKTCGKPWRTVMDDLILIKKPDRPRRQYNNTEQPQKKSDVLGALFSVLFS